MAEFSEYEDDMISFLMGHGMSEDEARTEVIERRVDLFGDDSHVITKEELDALEPPLSDMPSAADKVGAFRAFIGEEAWKAFGANEVNPDLLRMAIDFDYCQYAERIKETSCGVILSGPERERVNYYMDWYSMSLQEAQQYVISQRSEQA
jgi:hypothetical protein